jgi:hypothetical protein
MSDEGEQPREKAAQRPSKKRRNHALGLQRFSIFPQQAAMLARFLLVRIKRMELFFLQGLGGSWLVDVFVDRSDAN